MEPVKETQQKMERNVLILYGVYAIGSMSIVRRSGMDGIVTLVLLGGWIISFWLHLNKVRSYHFRSCFTALMLMSGVVVYGMLVEDLISNMVTIVAIMIMLGLYGNLNIILLSGIPVSFLILYHLVFLQEYQRYTYNDWTLLLQQFCSIYIANYIIYRMVKKQLEINDRQAKMIRDLKAAERSKDDFLANISHEIRTPVNTICGMSEIVLREDITDKVREDVYSIQEAGRGLISVVSDVLDFSELQTGKMQLEEVEYNIMSTIHDVMNMSMSKREQKKIEFIVDCSAKIPSRLAGDEQKIRRVIMNLMDNAVKFTSEGCISIIISCRKTKAGINLMVKVRDTGIGIREENIEKLFNSFSQVDTRRNRQEGGLGLGLAISRALVEEMGGFITIESTFGAGTQVKFVIPQKVVDDTPIVVLKSPEDLNVGVYINPEREEQVETRERYTKSTANMIKETGIKGCICRNIGELKRGEQREPFTHIFLSLTSYKEEEAYFDHLSQQTNIIVLLEQSEDGQITNGRIKRIYKPFFVLSVAAILNEEQAYTCRKGSAHVHNRFIAPQVHVLAVDDNLMNIRVLEGLLKPYQIQLTRAVSGFEALEKIETMDYDFIFMDHMMPEMDGVETLQRIRQKRGSYFKNVPVIALTANAIAGMRGMFLEKGFQDFMAKPVELSVLERVLERNIPANKLQKITAAEVAEEPHIQGDGVKEQDLKAEGLDVEKGISYCGGMDNYIEVLKIHCEEGDGNLEKLQNCYQQKDWKNYTIYVHALKSSMKSIGADKLSEMAKQLEAAGKEENTSVICKQHDKMIEEYKRILHMLKERYDSRDEEKEEEAAGQEVLDEEVFDAYLKDLEDATYRLAKEEMSDILTKLQGYSYHGKSLEKPLEQVKKKVEMLDLMSALEVVYRLRDRLRKQ